MLYFLFTIYYCYRLFFCVLYLITTYLRCILITWSFSIFVQTENDAWLYDSVLSCCVAVCPEVTIRNSIVKGETSCPLSQRRLILNEPHFIAVMCLLSQDLTWWKPLVWLRELTHLWRVWQPSLLSSTASPPTLCTETHSWHRAPSEIMSSTAFQSSSTTLFIFACIIYIHTDIPINI